MDETLRKTLEIIDNRCEFLEEQTRLGSAYERIELTIRLNELLKVKLQIAENLL